MPAKKLTSRQVNAKRKAEGLSPLNFALWRKVLRKLETAPMAYDQRQDVDAYDDRSPCGTAACIGGWADIFSAPSARQLKLRMKGDVRLGRASKALGLSWNNEIDEMVVVFTGTPDSNWPSPFDDQWAGAAGREHEARVAINYINKILATGSVT